MMNNEEKKNIEKSVVQIECVNKYNNKDIEFGTGFFVDKNIVVTASHVIENYYSKSLQYYIKVIPIKAKYDKDIKVKRLITSKSNAYVAILELEESIEIINPLKFTLGYKIERDFMYFTFGHPKCKPLGYPLENEIATELNEIQSKRADWELKVSGEKSDDFSGFSGAPVVINNMLIGIVQTQAEADGKALFIAMSSIDIIDDYIPQEYCVQYINKSNFEIERYRKWIKEVNSTFSILGIKAPLPIENAWIELGILSTSEIDKSNEEINLKKFIETYNEWKRLNNNININTYKASDITNFGNKIIVIGGPGAGKSTLCKKIAYDNSDQHNNVLFVKLPRVLKLIEQKINFEQAIIESAIDGFTKEKNSFINSFKQIDLLIADGLDECNKKKAYISELLDKWSVANKKTIIVVTTRPVGYDPSLFLDWQHVELLPLDNNFIDMNIKTILKSIYSNENKYLEKLQRVKNQIKNNKVASIASRSPLLLGFIIQLSADGINLGKTRVALYKQIVEKWLKKIDRETESNLRESIALRGLEIIGWLLQKAAYDEGLRSKRKLIKKLGKMFQLELKETKLRSEEIGELCIDFWQEQGILEFITIGIEQVCIFNHLNIGEYIAGCYLANMNELDTKNFIKRNYKNPYWREVILLAAGEGAVNRIIEGLIEEKCNSRDIEFSKIILAAECIDEYGNKAEMSRQIYKILLENLKSPIPIIAYESAEMMAKLSFEVNNDVILKVKELLNSKEKWTYIATMRVYLSFEISQIEKAYVIKYLMNYELSANNNMNRVLGNKGRIVKSDNFELCLKIISRDDLNSDLKEKLQGLIESGNISIHLCEKIVQKFEELGYLDIVEKFNKKQQSLLSMFFNDNIENYLRKSDLVFVNAVKRAIAIEVDNCNMMKDINEYRFLSKIFNVLGGWECSPGEWILFGKLENQLIYSEIMKVIINSCDIDIEVLAKEVISVLSKLEDGEKLYNMVVNFPVGVSFEKAIDKINTYVPFIYGIGHPSSVVYTASAKILRCGKMNDSELELAKETLFTGNKQSIMMLSLLLEHLWQDKALEFIIERLGGNLTSGCEYLYDIIPNLDDKISDKRIYEILQKGIQSTNSEIVEHVAESLKNYNLESIFKIKDSIKQSLIYWNNHKIVCKSCNIETNGSYCAKCRIVQNSPRAHLVDMLGKLNMLSNGELFKLTKDVRSDVREVAVNCLTYSFSNDLNQVLDCIPKIKNGEISLQILNAILKIDSKKLSVIKNELFNLITSDKPNVRFKIVESLSSAKWLSDEEAFEILNKTLLDSNESVRNISMITLQKRRTIGF